MRALILAIALIAALASEGRTSGAYGNSVATPTYRYSFEEHVRKSFIDSDSARQYMEEHDRAMKVHFLGIQAKVDKAIADAKKRGTPIGAYDPFLPTLRLKKAADIKTIGKKVYPFNLAIVVGSDRADTTFAVTATKPWTAAQITSLTATLKKIVVAKPNNEYSEERTARETKLVADAGFEAPVAATRVDETFALYVGTTTEVQAKHRAAYVKRLQQRLDAAAKTIDVTQLGVTLEKPVIKDANDFAPWGPLHHSTFVRAREDSGDVAFILMVVPKKPFEWDKVSPPLNKVLEASGAVDAHIQVIEEEDYRLNPR